MGPKDNLTLLSVFEDFLDGRQSLRSRIPVTVVLNPSRASLSRRSFSKRAVLLWPVRLVCQQTFRSDSDVWPELGGSCESGKPLTFPS